MRVHEGTQMPILYSNSLLGFRMFTPFSNAGLVFKFTLIFQTFNSFSNVLLCGVKTCNLTAYVCVCVCTRESKKVGKCLCVCA